MTATREQAGSATQPRAWLPVAAALLGIGWGANQITPMLLVYRHALGLGTGTLEAAFGVYALGLIPGLLIAGPLSDARGRRAVVVPAVALSFLASVLLTGATLSVALLFAGRLLAGVSSGAPFGAGTAWLRETSLPPLGTASDHTAARRAAVAMTSGFALGPLVAGIVAQWAPSPTVLPYLPHLAVMAVVWVLLRRAPETVTAGRQRVPRLSTPGLRSRRFRTVVAPMAPWVFAAPAIAFALLPSLAGAGQAANGIALTAALCALAGILVQPLARSLDLRPGRNRAAAAGLLVLAAGLVLGAVTAHAREVWLLVPSAIVLGCAYGMCLVAGLVEVQRLAGSNGAAGLTAIYYALTYLGFAAPYLIVLGTRLASYTVLLAVAALLALGTATLITRTAASEQAANEQAPDEQADEGASRSQAA